MALLAITDLTKCFTRRDKPFDAVSHVNLMVDAGEFVAIVGRSGNGKSTLINMIAGLVRPTSGSVTIDGNVVADLSDRELSLLRNRTIGFVTQSQTLLSNLTVLDNVILPATMFPEDKAPEPEQLIARAENLLKQLGVAELMESYPRELSGGEMRRVSIARALMNSPKLLIADEPTGDLDQESTDIVMQLLREQADSGTAVLMVTHDPDALRYADNVYRMDAGVLTEQTGQ
ncbi:ABC transporter ATP-binding protein [Bifidobacterium oedipodis]|uniref:ABC transporter ATP-binding protein n=1 Tax=Bifidobacterium oedipodis TaxID=2675322 RepID=A0A7Y0EMX2_9BIFI|nr:ABC transporter ATP-binding protein [Bifidobacterium sp. DSM 109957]NMM93218.1 ABC transporter ATP-binding protein [Bifidobacterium sp. DSM 109957]